MDSGSTKSSAALEGARFGCYLSSINIWIGCRACRSSHGGLGDDMLVSSWTRNLGRGDFDCELSNPATHSDSSTSGPTSSREQVCMRWWLDCGVSSVFLSSRVVSAEG